MLATITGPSAVGKSTVIKLMIKRIKGSSFLRTTTTRDPRPSDAPGECRHVSDKEFREMELRGDFAWKTAEFAGKRYGTLEDDALEALKSPAFFLAPIVPDVVPDIHAFAESRGLKSRVRSIFIVPPDREVILHRLTVERKEPMKKALAKIEECADWNRQTQDSRLFMRVADRNDVEDKYNQVLAFLKLPWL